MSDDFRIYNRQSGPESRLRKPGSGLERFRKGRRAGDMVRGVFLELEPASPGTAWVNLEGERLLAQLPEDLSALARRIFAERGVGARPTGVADSDFPLRYGDVCFFVLENLEPEPVLRMLSLRGFEGSATLALQLAREQALSAWRSVTGLPPAQLAARYVSQRNAMDNLLRRALWGKGTPDGNAAPDSQTGCGSGCDAVNSLLRYLDFVRADEAALAAYANLNLYRAGLILALKPYGLRGLCYLPWLNAEAASVELAILHKPEIYIFQARLPDGSIFEARGRTPGKYADLRAMSAGVRQTVTPLSPAGARPDLITELLGLYPETARSGFSLRT